MAIQCGERQIQERIVVCAVARERAHEVEAGVAESVPTYQSRVKSISKGFAEPLQTPRARAAVGMNKRR